jgi:myotubularin-related protein 6/7/8
MDKIRIAKVDNVTLTHSVLPSGDAIDDTPFVQELAGTLHLTPHHLIFSPTSTSTSIKETWVAYPTITLMTRLPQSIRGQYPVQVRTRLFNHYTLSFDSDRDADDVWQSVKDCAVTCKRCLHMRTASHLSVGFIAVRLLLHSFR